MTKLSTRREAGVGDLLRELLLSAKNARNGLRLKIIAHHKAEPDTKALAQALVQLPGIRVGTTGQSARETIRT